jgi:hypothetical protein
MKYRVVLAFSLLLSINCFSKEKPGKTFMILFNKAELKEAQSSPEYIELSLMDRYQTRTYSGHSEAALLVTFPNNMLTECEIGEILVQINPMTKLSLQEIAYRIIDLEENKANYNNLVAQNHIKQKN